MLLEIMSEVRNYFAADYATGQLYGEEKSEFKLFDGKLSPLHNNYLAGQYVALTGSTMNNGMYRVKSFVEGVMTFVVNSGENPPLDEEWHGTIYSVRVPKEFLQLVKKIEEFAQSTAGQPSNIASASFGVQSQSFGTNSSGVRAGWRDVFRQDLNKWRRMTPDIILL